MNLMMVYSSVSSESATILEGSHSSSSESVVLSDEPFEMESWVDDIRN